MRHHVVGALVLAATWGVAWLVVVGAGVQGPAREFAILSVCGCGLAASMFLRSTPASYILAGVLSFTLAEIGAHAMWGLEAVQGAPSHVAVLGAACLGVAGGAGVSWVAGSRTASSARRSPSPALPPRSPSSSTTTTRTVSASRL